MFKQRAMGAFVLAGAVALAGFTGLAYGQNGKPTTTTPTQVEVVNKTVLVGTATLHVTGTDAGQFRTPTFDVSPYSMVRLVVVRTGCPVIGGGFPYVLVENIANLDSFALSAGPTAQRIYDIPGESLFVMIGNANEGTVCDFTVTIYGRRN
jgi:hypothetical protein